MRKFSVTLSLLILCASCQPATPSADRAGRTGIIGKTTDDVGEYDPQAGLKVSEGKIDERRVATPLIGSLAAYGPIVEQISKLHIRQAVELFNAAEGRYPRDYQEFMSRIIEANQIQLPVLPGNLKYQYDVENHQLVVVEAPPGENLPK